MDNSLGRRAEIPAGLLISTLLLVFVPFVAISCSSEIASGPAPGESAPPPPAAALAPKLVRVVHPVRAGDAGYTSSLYVERDVRVTARRSGVIEKVAADRGEVVKAGAVLAILETDIATREVEMADQDVKLAQAELDRLGPLHDQKVVSPQDFLRAEIARDQSVTKAALARAWLDRCNIRAPFDGVVADRWAVPGLRVREEDAVPLFRVVARDPLRARVDLPEERLASVVLGGRAKIELPGGGTRAARVVFVSPAVDAGSGTAPVIVEAGPPDDLMRPGAAVMVRFDAPSVNDQRSFLVPREAFPAGAVQGQDTHVMVAAGGRALARRVHLLALQGNDFEVRGDLDAAEAIILLGAGSGIAEGELVQPREKEE